MKYENICQNNDFPYIDENGESDKDKRWTQALLLSINNSMIIKKASSFWEDAFIMQSSIITQVLLPEQSALSAALREHDRQPAYRIL